MEAFRCREVEASPAAEEASFVDPTRGEERGPARIRSQQSVPIALVKVTVEK